MSFHRQIFLAFLLIISLLLVSCYEDGGVPAYIHIEKLGLSTTAGQGTASHKITDAWVYIDGKLIGAFELPATFPVLMEGQTAVTIAPGIKINGIAATRSPYPFYRSILTSVNLIPGQVTTVTDTVTSYDPATTFVWMENFNGGAISLDTTSNSETRLMRTSNPELVFKYRNEVNDFSAMAIVAGDTALFECASINTFDLPRNGSPVFLEMNFRNNYTITVGLLMKWSGQATQQSVLVLNPSEVWNKIYINLTPTLAYYNNATDFRIFIGLLKTETEETATIYFDHLKLMY